MSSKAIAIVEDDSDLCNLFAEALRMNGFGKISAFTYPKRALHHIQKNPNNYSLILSDYRMPDINGHELCTKLIELNPELKVILMSAFTDVQYDTSKFTFLHKPIPISHLLNIVKLTLADNDTTNMIIHSSQTE